RLVRLALTRPRPQRSPGESDRFVRHILVRVRDDTGASGWGEIPRADRDLWDALVDEYAPALVGHRWQRPTEAAAAWQPLAPRPAVAAALDTACWDLWSRQRGIPLAHALGGVRTAVTAGVLWGSELALAAVDQKVNGRVGGGSRRGRLHIRPGGDVEAVRAVGEAFSALVLQVDGGARNTESTKHLVSLPN